MVEKIEFQSDGITIRGSLHLPGAPGSPVVIGAHGLLSTGDSPKQQALARQLNRRGIAYLRFDHRGCGKSDGVFSQVTTFAGRCNDLAAAIEYARNHRFTGKRTGLFGSSMGGAVCLSVAGDFEIATMVTLAAPIRLSSIQVPLGADTDPAFQGMEPGQMDFDITDRLDRIKNILVIHGDDDRIVPFKNCKEIFRGVGEPKKLLRLEKADHILSDPASQEQFFSNTLEWFTNRLAGHRTEAGL